MKFSILSFLLTIGISTGIAQNQATYNLARPDMEFKIFQFPHDQMPRIDGQTDDWQMVPASYRYGTDLIKDTEDKSPYPVEIEDLDISITVAWVKGLNRLYFLYEAYDDFWDFGRFNPEGYLNDILEIVVDGDLSGGPFITNPLAEGPMPWSPQREAYINNHLTFSGVHAQNYHIYTPPVRGAWCLVWGSQPWIAEFPQANYAYSYDFKHGESGKLVLECWITPYDYATYEGPEKANESELKENKLIGLSWSILDFDGDKREGHINLSHNAGMVKDADLLCAFRLMPIEAQLQAKIQAEWSFKVINRSSGLVAFRDESIGEIESWEWDFGDGDSSNEQHPIHQFKEGNVRHVISLTIKGPKGESVRTRYWEVMTK